jgi:hypothetical protein
MIYLYLLLDEQAFVQILHLALLVFCRQKNSLPKLIAGYRRNRCRSKVVSLAVNNFGVPNFGAVDASR